MARRRATTTPWVMRLLAATLLAGACGCGNTATVTGKVTYQGRPVTHGSVTFLSADSTARSGVILPDGAYTVAGVHPGAVKIGVISRDPSKGRSTLAGDKSTHRRRKAAAPDKTLAKGWFPLPAKFEDPERSGLGCTLASGGVGYDIDLK
jgi:hypothetical protein